MLTAFKSRPPVERALAIAALTSGALLAGAHAFETFGGLAPCELCLDQREAHWTGLSIALVGLFFGVALKSRRAAAAAAAAAALVYFLSAGLAAYHVGVEHKFWPGPVTCAGGGPVEIDGALIDALSKKPAGPSCADVPWQLFGVSMAGYNLIISAGLFALCVLAAAFAAREARRAARPNPDLPKGTR